MVVRCNCHTLLPEPDQEMAVVGVCALAAALPSLSLPSVA